MDGHRRTKGCPVQLAGQGKQCIADRFSLEAFGWAMMPEQILGIGFHGLHLGFTRYLVSSGLHDVSDHALDALPVFQEFCRQMIKQLRMSGPLTQNSEVIDSWHYAPSEKMVPYAVDDDS